MAKKFREEEKKIEKKEEEKKESMVAQDEAEEKKQAAEPEQDKDHEDIAKDKALILDMIKKHMGKGDDEEMGEEEKGPAHEAYEAFLSMGKDKEEAMKCAAEAMKLAKHMAEKRHAESEKKEEEKCESEKKEGEKCEEVVPMTPKADPEKYSAKKEADIKLVARIAFLERELKKRELGEVLDQKLKESGLGRAETDKIRECIGAPKSESQIVETIKIFKEAFNVRGGESALKKEGFFVTTERTEIPAKTSKVSFSDF